MLQRWHPKSSELGLFESWERAGKAVYYGGVGLALITGTILAWKIFDTLFGE